MSEWREEIDLSLRESLDVSLSIWRSRSDTRGAVGGLMGEREQGGNSDDGDDTWC